MVATASLLCGFTAVTPALAAPGHPASPARPGAATRAATGAGAANGHARATYQTPEQALAQAARTGKAVPVTGATTATSTLTANPNGTLTLTENAEPVRAQVNGTWRNLNPDLVRNADGTWSPAVSSTPLALSGGGGPLATMTDGPYSLSVSAPVRLPAPTVSGATATYADVLPGVDLIVTATASGGYSDTLRVDNRAAASDPGLASLTFTTKARGLSLGTAGGGSVAARDSRGQVIFAAPAPRMWDSTVRTSAVKALTAGATASNTASAERAGLPVRSTVTQPALGARTAPLGVAIKGGSLTLSPSRALLTSPAAAFPEYIAPFWQPSGSSASNWAYVSSDWPTQQYYDVNDFLQVGVDPDTGGTSYSFYSLSIPTAIRGSYINSATAYFPEVWADSCTASPVDLYETGSISSSTTYDNQPSWGTDLGSDDVAYGWNSSDVIGGASSCPIGAKDVAYDIKSVAESDAAIKSGSFPAFNVGLKAESSSAVGWKLFADPRSAIDENATITINYAFTPSTPTLSTSDGADCESGASVVGDGNINFIATGQDADEFAPTVNYTIYADGKSSDSIKTASSASAISGTRYKATLQLSSSTLESADTSYGANGEVTINWTANADVGLSGLPASGTASCKFTFSTAKPGMPNVTDSTGTDCNSSTQAFTIGTPAILTATGNAAKAAPANPDSYVYQLNGGSPVTVSAARTSPYTGNITFTPTRITNILTVTAVAAGNSVGETYTCWITAAAPAEAVDQDLTGDGIPDLLTVGSGTTGTAPGLWLADGKAADTANGPAFDGTVSTTATDIAPYGPQGLGTSQSDTNVGTPDSWNGLKAVTGQFVDPTPGFNDIEAYKPAGDQVYLLQGQGDGSIATSQDLNLTDVLTNTPYIGSAGDQNLNSAGNPAPDYPVQLANAYDASVLGTSNTASPYPDQIGVFTDPTIGSYLGYFQNNDGDNSFDAETGTGPWMLTNDTPDGTMDWNDWTITTDYRPSAAYPEMYLWNQTTGALWMWQITGLSNEVPGGVNYNTIPFSYSNSTAGLDVNATKLSADTTAGTWNKGVTLNTLQAADIMGNPGVMAVTSTGQVQSWELNGTTFSQVNATDSTQTLLTADHTYLLNNGTTGAVSTAADTPGAGDTEDDMIQNTAANKPSWKTDGMFSPDVSFNGTSDYLTSSTQTTFDVTEDYTVSAWVRLDALGGTVFSKNGPSYANIKVGSNTNGTWFLSVNTGGNSYNTINVGTADAGTWYRLVLTYDTSSGNDVYRLYANGSQVGMLAETSGPTSVGRVVLGAAQGAGPNDTTGSWLDGELADVQIWSSLAVPVQPASPASAFVAITPERIMDTRSGSKVGSVTGPVAAGSAISVPIADEGGTTGAPFTDPDITAVAASVTVTGQSGAGFLTVYPDGSNAPGTSALDYASSGVITNSVIAPVGPDGKITIKVNDEATQLLVDVTGYFTANTSATGASTYTPLANSSRVFYTGNGTGVPKAQIAAGSALTFHVADDNGTTGAPIIRGSVTAVALDIGVLSSSGTSGWLEAYPDGIARPASGSEVSFTGPQTSSTTVIVPVSASNGDIDLYNGSNGPIDIVGDLYGYFTTATTGQYYHATSPIRVVDTRLTVSGAVAANGTIGYSTPSDIAAVNPTLILNVTVTGPTEGGYLKAYPGSQPAPGTSLSDFAASSTVAAMALVNTANQNNYVISNNSSGTSQIIIDATGYFN